jgi:hypothetical protein
MSDEALIAELERQSEFARQWFEHFARQKSLSNIGEDPKPSISDLMTSLNPVLRAAL